MSIATIGIIGVGNMGLGMAQALRNGGFAVMARELAERSDAIAARGAAGVGGA